MGSLEHDQGHRLHGDAREDVVGLKRTVMVSGLVGLVVGVLSTWSVHLVLSDDKTDSKTMTVKIAVLNQDQSAAAIDTPDGGRVAVALVHEGKPLQVGDEVTGDLIGEGPDIFAVHDVVG